ncbi:hypothetical protein [Comamonas sp. 26]|uniref:hypothetical protein n=1 Tax=Comamonas sp. 26 TaxID=2035201 RepID=UPI000C38E381|nr:hypothetical protein [Comamonas sp. 26]PIG08776.1 hypothetical protein CLU84_1647 [Comamonas sp. 26]
MNTLNSIVTDDNAISDVLNSDGGFKLQQLVDLYRTAPDRDAFICTLCMRLLLEHQQRVLRPLPATTGQSQTAN